ncbi:MAG: hypothetical protein HQ556_11665 [Candidatus Marinimicrobia bacterium]|nr:hypothetical protein [Candidatus Neomarinimicrobiota bacterium]
MKYFTPKHTVGSPYQDSPGPIPGDKEKLIKQLEDYKKMKKDKLGRIFSPLTRPQEQALAELTKNNNHVYSTKL